ncbi:glycosyltransferase [Flavobacterium sp. 14A]|uniref:glycosyltransferase n=1 Tax=Flavobacterium sp. 14A TaxID=2735896 RepID=UPI00156F3FA0|nr:glycosyltransferase [Flavobacterium sp. 14A]NRT13280.1 glycosyltransferase involved in cell wall biosynthesis [Flavobacterium sp. 14A]
MKIIHILNELKYSGAEIMYVDAAPIFQSLGCELSVVATANSLGEFAPKFKKAGYTVYHKSIPSKSSLFKRGIYYLSFIKFLKTEKYDVLHNHSNSTYWGMALCAKLAGVKSVYTFHNVFPTSWYSRWYHLWLRWSAKKMLSCTFQTISDSVYQNELKVFFNKTILINNWYGNNRFYPAVVGEKELVREELGIDKDALVLISVGGCSHIKRHSDIIEALPIILEKYPNTIYLHLGEGDDLCKEKELSKKLIVDDNIIFMGNQTDVRKFLVASDIYLMTSKHEGLPITTIENMGCGIPSILYDVPGLRDFNATQRNSLVIKPRIVELVKSIGELHCDASMKEQISNKAKSFVDEKYNMANNVKLIFNLYISHE